MRAKIADLFYLMLVAAMAVIVSPLWLIDKMAKLMVEKYGEGQ